MDFVKFLSTEQSIAKSKCLNCLIKTCCFRNSTDKYKSFIENKKCFQTSTFSSTK